jgi:hypothetical protein
MIRRILIYFARRSRNVLTQYRLATLVGLLTCFGAKGTFAIYIKIGQAVIAQQEKQKRRKPATKSIEVKQ